MRHIRRRTKVVGGILLVAVSAILFDVSDNGLLMATALIGGTVGLLLFGHGVAQGSPLGYFEEEG
ncbi:MAG: hypothetical protein HYT42_01630 [Candidatus Sungbacteria bacterium]|uniref:DUF2892 domain-containing protein n=1 Tax=Candidatus Sungiibacteriota bacterium TaxID=2750080 RepID=A0A933DTT7_9BACT|nr:hypothetical protein [Candidatus Sungbacteria bacterium]MBI4132268.1 hypothetical protein [Candidatus Sungbacteria bacterium]